MGGAAQRHRLPVRRLHRPLRAARRPGRFRARRRISPRGRFLRFRRPPPQWRDLPQLGPAIRAAVGHHPGSVRRASHPVAARLALRPRADHRGRGALLGLRHGGRRLGLQCRRDLGAGPRSALPRQLRPGGSRAEPSQPVPDPEPDLRQRRERSVRPARRDRGQREQQHLVEPESPRQLRGPGHPDDDHLHQRVRRCGDGALAQRAGLGHHRLQPGQ